MQRATPSEEIHDEAWLAGLDVLRTDRLGDYTRQRLVGRDGQPHWLSLSATWSQGSAARQLEGEHRLTMGLDPAYVCQTTLLRTSDGPVLLIEDGPDERGLGVLGLQMPIVGLLAMAHQAAAALSHIHERGLLHGDVRPESFVRDQAGRVRLTNLSRARAQSSPSPGPAPDDALPYAAPEAALRAAPWADQRSDLYSLGITLFEMFTGQPPFLADTAADWLHAHVAILPPRPSTLRLDTPTAIDAIILKLTAKNPDARYQSAASLCLDLARCLAAWSSGGAIAPFPLDVSAGPRLYAPRQVGRDVELGVLENAFERVRAAGAPEMVFVTGSPGSGKSFLVETFLQGLDPSSATYCVGRGQLANRHTAYGVTVQVLRRLLQDLLDQDRLRLDERRRSIVRAVGADARAIIDLAPEYEILLGQAPHATQSASETPRVVLERAITSVLAAFAADGRPLIVVLDDLQWCDPASWSLLRSIAADAPQSVLLICVHRSDEQPRSDPFASLRSVAKHSGPRLSCVSLQSLAPSQVATLMAQAMLCPPGDLAELPGLIHAKTGGNPYFAFQFLQALLDERLLRRSAAGRWIWQAEDVLKRSQTDNVVDLLLHRVERLNEASRDLLQKLAWIGASGSRRLLMALLDVSIDAIDAAAAPLVDAGLLVSDELCLAFSHDRIQEAAYALTPRADLAVAHARVAAVMIDQVAPDADLACQLANQIELSASDAMDDATVIRIARVLLPAARRALGACAAEQAWRFLQAAGDLLKGRTGAAALAVAHDVALQGCLCLLQQGRLEEAAVAIERLQRHAPSTLEQARAHALSATLSTLQARYDLALEACSAGLALLGFEAPPRRKPSAEERDEAFAAVRTALGDQGVIALADLPVSEDETLAVVTHLLAAMSACAVADEGLGFVLLARIVELSLLRGATPHTPQGLAWFGVVGAGQYLDYVDGRAYAETALRLVDRHGWEEARATVLVAMGQIGAWTEPLSQSLEVLRQAVRSGEGVGDHASSSNARTQIVSNLLAIGAPLAEVAEEARRALGDVHRIGFRHGQQFARAQLAYVTSLLVGEDHSGTGEQQTSGPLDARQTSQPRRFGETLTAGICAYLHGRREVARRNLALARSDCWSAPAHIELVDLTYFTILADTAAGDQPLARDLEALRSWAELNPSIFRARSLLAQAQAARVGGDVLGALPLYEAAANEAAVAGQWRDLALSHELAGDFARSLGLETGARAHYQLAHQAYEGWGAAAKARQLEDREPYLVRGPAPRRGPAVSGQAALDTAAALKAAQTLSEEILLNRVIEKLMTTMLVHAGADYGVLLLAQPGGLSIEAVARVGASGPTIETQTRPPTAQDLSMAVLNTVLGSGRPVILEDAVASAAHPGATIARARSLAGLPLIKQGRMIGVLYLENRFLPAVFTPERMRLLELLAPQAAISLENAQLYAQVLDQDARRRRSEAALNAARSELAKTAHLTAMGGLAASIGHEINQPLHSIVANVGASLRWLARDPPDLAEVRTNLDDIGKSALRAGSIVKGLRALARNETVPKSALIIDDVVREVVALTGSEIDGQGADLVVTLGAGAAQVLADAVQLQQVVLNLITNALDAMRQTPSPLLKVRSSVSGGRVTVAVEDNGPGVAPQVRDRMFDPLFTTKSSGMGMGLAICRSIIEAHGGALELAAPEGQGARFEFELPLIAP